jgi:putative ABC transport system ATP-binding protein
VVAQVTQNSAVLDIRSLRFAYGDRTVLQLEELSLQAGETGAVLGPSGSGKTTLLHLIAGLLRPTQGTVAICGQRLDALGATACDRFRGRHLGIVFQRLHLLPALSVLDNLLLAQRLARVAHDAKAAQSLLDALDIGALAGSRPASLSQGQAQRVAIARALVHKPSLLLADEPTSSLDDDNAARAIDLLRTQARAVNAALLVVTHDQRIRGKLDRELRIGSAS